MRLNELEDRQFFSFQYDLDAEEDIVYLKKAYNEVVQVHGPYAGELDIDILIPMLRDEVVIRTATFN